MPEVVLWPQALQMDAPTNADYALGVHLLWDVLHARVPVVVDEQLALAQSLSAAIRSWPDSSWRDQARRILDTVVKQGLLVPVAATEAAPPGCPTALAVSVWLNRANGTDSEGCAVVPPQCRCGGGFCAQAWPRTTPDAYARDHKGQWWACQRFEIPAGLTADEARHRYLEPLFRYTRTLRLVDRYAGKQWRDERWRAALRWWVGAWRRAMRRREGVPGPAVRIITWGHSTLADGTVWSLLDDLDGLVGRPGGVALVALDPDAQKPAPLHRRYVVTDQGTWTVDPGLDVVDEAGRVPRAAHLLPHARPWQDVRAQELPGRFWTGRAMVWCGHRRRPASLTDAG
jgi:hypothetical protein